MSLVPLGTTARFINGAAFKPSDWGAQGLPIIRIQNLTGTNGGFNYTTRPVKPELVVEPGDLLVSWSATLDVYRWTGSRGVLNQHIFKVIPNNGVDPDYLYFALKSVIAELQAKTHGSTMKHVVRGDFEGTRIPLPPLGVQRRIVDLLSRAEGIVRLRREAQKKTAEIIPALFFDMFGDRQIAPAQAVLAPIEQERAVPACGHPSQQRTAIGKVQHVGRIDQRGYEEHRRPFAAIVAQHRAVPVPDHRHRGGRRRAIRLLKGTKAGQRALHPGRVCCGFAAQHFHEQCQRPRLVLRCGKLRC